MDGWIKLHRELLDHWIYKDSEYLKVWIEMLIRARYWDEPSKELIGDQLVKVERGEFIFGRPKWSSRLGISEQRLKTLITKMIKEDMIEPIQKFPRFTLYRIKNYEKFNQQDNQQSNQHNNQQESHIQQGFDLSGNQHINQQDNQQSNQRSTSSQPAPNQQPTNNKERSKKDKNDKNEKEVKNNSADPPVQHGVYHEDFESFWTVFPKYRRKDKAKTFGIWKKKIKESERQLLIQCTERYAADKKTIGPNGQFAKMPSTYLNAGTYKDYLSGGDENETIQHSTGSTGKYSEFTIE